MTAQADEIIEYRGEQFSFRGQPLDLYLQNREHIKFDLYTTANWRGYQGHWKLEDNRLFLTQLESTNQSLNKIFGQEAPILADWFTGQIAIGLGEPQFDDWSTHYDHYLWLDFEKGIVQHRHIIRSIDSDFIIEFGKYKGKRVSEILRGKVDRTFNLQYDIKAYLQEVVEFFQHTDYQNKIIAPYFSVTDETKKIIANFRRANPSMLLTRNFLAIEKRFYINSEGEEETELFSKLVERILSSDFSTVREITKFAFPEATVAEATLLLNPDFGYINWAMKTVDKFAIAPHLVEGAVKTKFLRRFSINRLNSTIFEYDPIIETVEHSFPTQTLQINRQKFQSLHQVQYDKEKNIYTVDMPQDQLVKRFGHFLDESYLQAPSTSKPFYADNHDEYAPSYEKYNGAYGYDDDTIDTAFEGDPQNYWNID